MGNDIVGGNIYSENYSSTAGTHIDLNNGDFSFAGGKLTYDSKGNILNVIGKITFESIDFSNDSTETAVKDSLGITAINKEIIGSNSTINKLKRCLGFTTEISSDYVISPYIGGGYLNISNNSHGSVIIDPSNIKKSGYIFGIYNNSSNLVMDVDTKGDGVFKGDITTSNIIATGGTIGGWTIGERSLYADYDVYRTYIQVPAKSTDWVFSAQSKSDDSYAGQFIVQGNSKLTAKNADISGKINAESGTIGEWKINGNELYSISDNNKYKTYIQKATDENTWVFSTQTREGDDELYGRFYVCANGNVTTQDMTINGDMALYGDITTDIWANKNIYVKDKITVGGTTYWIDYILSCHGNAYIDGEAYINGKVESKGTIEISNVSNASNLILHNGYNRKIYLRYDEQSRFYIVPHTPDGFDSQNCFYMDAYTGDCCARSFVNASSIRYKENIKTLSDDFIDNFSKIRPVSFDYKPNIGYKNQYGLIAEEMEEIYPYVVTHDRDGNCEAIDYSKLTVLLIKKIQSMDKEIQSLNETISQHNINK